MNDISYCKSFPISKRLFPINYLGFESQGVIWEMESRKIIQIITLSSPIFLSFLIKQLERYKIDEFNHLVIDPPIKEINRVHNLPFG